MTMVEKKHRPSMTTGEVRLTVKWLDNAIRIAVQNADAINHSEIAGLVKIKDYLQSFIKSDSVADLIRQYSAQANTANAVATNPIDVPRDSLPATPTTTGRASPLDNPNLSDDDKLDILSLLSDDERTEEETKWYLNVGTLIKLQRMQSKGVKCSDL